MAHVEIRESTELVKDYYIDYAKYVLETRALPSIYDGLKFAQRRLVYVSSKSGMRYSKSSKILGDTIPYHPHGLDSLYGVLVNMTTDMNPCKLFQGKGNWGGVGFGAAAYRYTEAYLNEMARFMYTKFSDYADYVEGESGLEEPKALPALIPYSLLVGSTGIGVGLSTNIMPLDFLELIDYYISVIKREEPKTPTPDLGNYILDMSDKEIDKAVEGYEGRLKIKSVITVESETQLVIDESYGKDIHKIAKSMPDLIDTGIVDFRDETTTEPRYVFEIIDEKKISMNELKKRLEKLTTFSKSFKRLVADGEVGVYAPLRYQVDKSLEYLNECLDRMFEDRIRKLTFEEQVLQAIKSIRTSGLLEEIPNLTSNQLKKKVRDLGFEKDVVDTAVSKNITYLTKSHDDELKEIEKEIKNLKSVDRKSYLIDLYSELRKLVKPIYEKANHTVRRSKLLKTPKFSLIEDKIRISNHGTPFDSVIYAVHADSSMTAYHIGSMVSKDIALNESDSFDLVKLIPDTKKFVIFITSKDRFLATDISRASNRIMVRLDDDEKVVDARVADEEDSMIPFPYKRKKYDAKRFYRQKLSIPQSLGKPIQ